MQGQLKDVFTIRDEMDGFQKKKNITVANAVG